MLGRSLPIRIAIFSSLISGGCILFSASFFGFYQKNQLEKQLIAEAREYAERFTTWTLGYFYQQDNLLHLETQQRFLSESPNIVYSYIVRDDGTIDVGVGGISSPDVGQKKQSWEPDLPVSEAGQISTVFSASDEVAKRFEQKVNLGDEIVLVGFPISCPERALPCAQLRVALVPQSARGVAAQLTFSFIVFGILAATGTGLAVFYAARRQVSPLVRITNLMEQAHESGEQSSQSVQAVRRALAVTENEETKELTSLRKSLLSYLDVLELSTAQGAIARSIQAFAHDVRKPFSMFRAILDSVRSTSDLTQVREILVRAIPEVNRAMKKVDVMIQDVMRIGSGAESRLDVRPVEPQQLMRTALEEVFSIYTEAQIQISYELQHSHQVRADAIQMSRVFLNIVENAIQAMGEKGQLWFKTRDAGAMVEFCLGNSDSLISEDKIARIFDLFYTSGKAGGTGLGLAIVKKIVELHGGKIRCESSADAEFPRGKVEFIFTLPADARVSETSLQPMPTDARGFFTLTVEQDQNRNSVSASRDADGSEIIVSALKIHIANYKQKYSILIIDDEEIYSEGLKSLLHSVPELRESFVLTSLQKIPSDDEFSNFKNHILIVQDIDLGVGQPDGFASIRAARASGFQGHICVHSNRLLASDNKAALEAGADTILPKPMTRTHFLKIILNALERSAKKKRIAYVDDSEFMLHVLKSRLGKHCDLKTFNSPEKFFSALETNNDFLSSCDAIITDYFFAAGTEQTGFTVASRLRALGFTKPVFLLSDAEVEASACQEHGITAKLGKSAQWEDILPQIIKS